jgi:hypothetical protein
MEMQNEKERGYRAFRWLSAGWKTIWDFITGKQASDPKKADF